MKTNRDDMPAWEKAYWSNREQQKQQQPAAPTSFGREINAGDILAQRMMMQGSATGGSTPVMLREGMPYYKLIPNPDGFGTATPLIRHMGTLSQVAGKEFVLMNELRGYLIEANVSVIDLSKMSESPEKFLTLLRVRAPFAGDILVAKEAVVYGTTSSVSRGILRG